MRAKKYIEGIQMDNFKHLPEISTYNRNYYVGYDKDLLFGDSDDDNTTIWYLVYEEEFRYLGKSYTSEGDILINDGNTIT